MHISDGAIRQCSIMTNNQGPMFAVMLMLVLVVFLSRHMHTPVLTIFE